MDPRFQDRQRAEKKEVTWPQVAQTALAVLAVAIVAALIVLLVKL